MDPEGIKLSFNGYEWAIKKPALMGNAVPIEASVELKSLRLDKKKVEIKDVQKARQGLPRRGREGRLWSSSRNEDVSELMTWLAGGWYKASEKRFERLKWLK